MRSFCVFMSMLAMNFNLHKRNTENAGKKAVVTKTFILRAKKSISVMPANSNGKRMRDQRNTKVGKKSGGKTEEKIDYIAGQHYEEGSFPFANLDNLRAIEYPALVIPKQYSGLGISLYERLKMQETIATYDGSTALAIV